MDQQLLQRTRYLLQRRFRRINTSPFGNFELVCQQVLNWLETHPVISSIIMHLDNLAGEHHQEIKLLVSTPKIGSSRYFYIMSGRDQRQEHEPEFKGYTPKTRSHFKIRSTHQRMMATRQNAR